MEEEARGSVVVRLVVASALMLFLELALIRWLGANVVHLSYFTNFVLLGSFLGIGVGFLIARKSWSLFGWTPVLVAALVVLARVFPVTIDRAGDNVLYWTGLQTAGPPPWLALPIIFLLVAAALAGPAEVVGRCFLQLPPLTAYRWDLVGSITGISAFTALSWFWLPSWVWGTVVAVAMVALLPGLRRWLALACGAVIVVTLVVESSTPGVFWSPYYKISTLEKHDETYGDRTQLLVNGVPHQTMSTAEWKLDRASEIYGAPYDRRTDTPLDNVLVIGAGSGSDVAIALAEGAKHVDAVDIDPAIMKFGVDNNPDRVYQDPRVEPHVNDGRAFPGEHRPPLRPDPVRTARLALAGQRRLADPAGVVPVHRTRAGGGPRPAHRPRRVHDVQLQPRAVAGRPARWHRGGGLRPRAVHRPHRRGQRGGDDRRRTSEHQQCRGPTVRTTRWPRRTTSPRPPTTGRSCTTPAG